MVLGLACAKTSETGFGATRLHTVHRNRARRLKVERGRQLSIALPTIDLRCIDLTMSSRCRPPRIMTQGRLRVAEAWFFSACLVPNPARKFHGHARALSRSALGGDAAAVGFHEGFRNRQAQTEAAGGAVAGGVSTVKAFEDVGQVGGGNAGAVVLECHPRAAIVVADRHFDRSAL